MELDLQKSVKLSLFIDDFQDFLDIVSNILFNKRDRTPTVVAHSLTFCRTHVLSKALRKSRASATAT